MQAAQALTHAHYPARFLCYVTQSSLAILGFPLETISSSRDVKLEHWNLVVAGTKAMTY